MYKQKKMSTMESIRIFCSVNILWYMNIEYYLSKQILCRAKIHFKRTEDMASLCFIFSFVFSRALVWAGKSCNNHFSEYGFALVDHVYKSFFADRLVSCYMSCTTQPACQSLIYNLADKTCEFNNDTKYFRPKYFVEKPTFVYAENPDSGTFLVLLRISEIVPFFLLCSRYFSSLLRQFLLAVYKSLSWTFLFISLKLGFLRNLTKCCNLSVDRLWRKLNSVFWSQRQPVWSVSNWIWRLFWSCQTGSPPWTGDMS